jgi:drug/metabolite transporter (DMT)-like permease
LQDAETTLWPQGHEWWWVIAMATMSFVGGWSHFAALNAHSGAVKLGMFYMMLPVAASLPKLVLKGELPTCKMIIAWILVGVAIWLISSDQPQE